MFLGYHFVKLMNEKIRFNINYLYYKVTILFIKYNLKCKILEMKRTHFRTNKYFYRKKKYPINQWMLIFK